jgi:hypothetical protein
MNGVSALFKSEKGLMALIVILASAVLAGLRILPINQWEEIQLWVLGIYTTGKTVQGVASVLKTGKTDADRNPLPAHQQSDGGTGHHPG